MSTISDNKFCLCCQVPILTHDELCLDCAVAWRYCVTANNEVGHCLLCPPGDWADLYWSA